MKIKLTDIMATLARLTAPPPPRKGPPLWARAKGRRRAAANRRKRSMMASDRRAAEMEDERRATGRRRRGPWGEMMHQVILRAMEPGGWYARADVVNLTGFERDPTAGKLKDMCERGLLRREQNPAWDPKHHPSPQAIQEGREMKEPQWLYVMTELGEKERARLPGQPSSESADGEGVTVSEGKDQAHTR